MSRTVIGILAGMGPRTTSPFLERILDLCRTELGATWDDEYPNIVIYSLPTPYRPDRPLVEEEMVAALERGAKALRRAGASFVAVPCNVAHIYFHAIEKGAGVPVLHIAREAVARVPREGPLAVLTTRATRRSGLYGELGASVNVEQHRVDALIADFKQNGESKRARELWTKLRDDLRASGVKRILLACTDLAFCANEPDVYDSLDILARATIREYIAREPEAVRQSRTSFSP